MTRAIAFTYVALLLVATARLIPPWIDFRTSQARETAALLGDGGRYVELALAAAVVAIIGGSAWVIIGGVIEWRRSRDVLGNLLFVGFVATGVINLDVGVIVPMQRADSWPQFQVPVLFVANAISVPWIYAFPDGRIVPRWAVVPGAMWFAWSVGRIFTSAIDQSTLGTPAVFLSLALVLGPIPAGVYRYVKRSNFAQRQQLKWVLFGALVYALAYIATLPIPIIVPELAAPGPAFVYHTATRIWLSLSLVVVAFALAIAVLRDRLLDVDLVIRRTVVYGIVGTILAAVFVLLSLAVQGVLVELTGERSGLATTLVALVVAAGFGPVRSWVQPKVDRLLPAREFLTVWFLDIVGSTVQLAEMGDQRWRDVLAAYRAAVRRELRAFGGREIDTAGDGFFATFDDPLRAVRCAVAVRAAVQHLGLQTRAGLHVGECEMRGEKVSGLTVHIGARLMSAAEPGEIIASRALRDLIDSSAMCFDDHGARARSRECAERGSSSRCQPRPDQRP